MKTTIAVILLFAFVCFLCQGVVFAELTKEDVRKIVREEIEPLKIEIAEIKGKLELEVLYLTRI
jgi:hypothetical protein